MQKTNGPAAEIRRNPTRQRRAAWCRCLFHLWVALSLTWMPLGAGEDPAPAAVAPHTESLRVVPAVPFINIFLTAGPFTESQLKDFTPDGKPAAIGAEPAGLANPAHHTWQLCNQGRYPAQLGGDIAPAKEKQWLLVSFDLGTDQPGGRYLQMHTNYGRRLRAWQGDKQIYFQDVTTYQTTGTNVTLGAAPETFVLAVELAATPSMLDLGILDKTGAKSTAAHTLRLNLPGDYSAARLFSDGMIYGAPSPVLNDKGEGEIRVWGCSPKLAIDKKITLYVKQGDIELGHTEYANSAALEERGVAFTVKPAATASRVPVQVGVAIEGETLPARSVELYSLPGIQTDLAALDAEIARLPADAAPNTRFLRESVAMLIKTAVTPQVGLDAQDAAQLVGDLDRMRTWLAAEAKGENPFAGKTGYSEQAYVAPQDHSVQPYLVYVPSDYDPAKQYPLVCYLHGYVPTYDRHNWIDLKQIPEFVGTMERNSCILAVPFARSNTDFLQVGEADTLAVIERMQAQYSVDPTRVYLYGYSMGGSGVYTLGSHYPQKFAAAVVLAGRTDYYLWHSPSKQRTPRFKQVMISRDNPIEQIDNFFQLPVQIHHGSQDIAVSLDHSRGFCDAMQARNYRCELKVYAGGSHWIGVDVMGRDEPLQWLLQFRRTTALENVAQIKTWSSKFGARANFSILLTADPTQPAELAAHWNNGKLTVDTMNNVLAFEIRNISPVRRDEFELAAPRGLELKTEWAADKAMLSRAVVTLKASPLTMAALEDPARILKTPDTAGTVQDAFNGPFVITYGTQVPADTELNKRNAETWAREWYDFAKGLPRVLADTEITPELAAANSLVLVGNPASHRYWAQLQPKLPIEVKNNVVTVDDRTVDLGADKGLLYIYPNPDAPRRYVVLNSGIHYGLGLPVNHKLDLVPDFLVYSQKTMTGGDDTNTPLIGGFFGPDWKLDPRLIDAFNE